MFVSPAFVIRPLDRITARDVQDNEINVVPVFNVLPVRLTFLSALFRTKKAGRKGCVDFRRV